MPLPKQPPLDDDQLMTMVRVYHGFRTDAEMVDAIGYDLDLYIVKMRRAYNAATGVEESTH